MKKIFLLLATAVLVFVGYYFFTGDYLGESYIGGGTGGGTQNSGEISTPSLNANTINCVKKTIKIDEINWETYHTYTQYGKNYNSYYAIIDNFAFLLKLEDCDIDSFSSGDLYVIADTSNKLIANYNKSTFDTDVYISITDYNDSNESLNYFFETLTDIGGALRGQNGVSFTYDVSITDLYLFYESDETANSIELLSESFDFETIDWIDTSLTTSSAGQTGNYYYHITDDGKYLLLFLSYNDLINRGTLSFESGGESAIIVYSKNNVLFSSYFNNLLSCGNSRYLKNDDYFTSIENIANFLENYVSKIRINLSPSSQDDSIIGTKIETIDISYLR